MLAKLNSYFLFTYLFIHHPQFALAGMKLEEDDKEEMERLMIQMRDCVLTSESKYTRETLLRCIRMYATRWGSVKP